MSNQSPPVAHIIHKQQDFELVIYNNLGVEMHRVPFENQQDRFVCIDFFNLQDGLYFISIIRHEQTMTRRLVVSKI